MNARIMIAATTLFAGTTLVATAAFACGGDSTAEIPSLSVTEVAQMIESGEATPVDANSENTRSAQGIVPGAVLLSSYEFDTAELAAVDTTDTLVFYCYSESCSAAPQAAARAQAAGWANVAVMPQGITGWVAEGQEVASLELTN